MLTEATLSLGIARLVGDYTSQHITHLFACAPRYLAVPGVNDFNSYYRKEVKKYEI